MLAFFDTNVIIYSVGADRAKSTIAERHISDGGWISVQVLNEIANVSRRKMRHEWTRTCEIISAVSQFMSICDLTVAIHHHGCDLAERYGFAVYDAMIVSAAIETKCDVLYSEDLHDGLVIDGRLRIINPFAPVDVPHAPR